MDTETLYGCKEIPCIKISLMRNDEIVFSFKNIEAIEWDYCYGTNEDTLYITLRIMNPNVYSILISTTYDKYIIEWTNIWRNLKTGEYETFEMPSRVFTNFNISNKLSYEDNPTEWNLKFWNNKTGDLL